MTETTDNILVMIRIRPLNERERTEDNRVCLKQDEKNQNTLIIENILKNDIKHFNFDYICPELTPQHEIFDLIGFPIANICLQGYNACIFAYGQTGAGKTYTIQGNHIDRHRNNEKRGILPRVIEYIFSQISRMTKNSDFVDYLVKCTYLEIYNEHIIDLLTSGSGNLQFREDLRRGVYVEGLSEEIIPNAEETLEVLKKGNRNRHISSTAMNIESSRSHSVFTLYIESKTQKDGLTSIKSSRFNFVDLAGSERQKQVGTLGDRLKEGCLINKSLSVLAQVINSLVEISEGKSRFIHYRDSKLTFLLKDSLGGNSKTSIIANVSPAISAYSETMSTLKFAQGAKLIKNKISINEDSSGNLESLKLEIKRLRLELAAARSGMNLKEININLDNVGAGQLIKKVLNNPQVKDATINQQSTNNASSSGGSNALSSSGSLPVNNNQNDNNNNSTTTNINEQKVLEMEIFLKQCLEILTESEIYLHSELSKKDQIINELYKNCDIYNKNELQLKLIINLLQDKVTRYKHIIDTNSLNNKEDLVNLIHEDYYSLEKQNHALMNITKNIPIIMKTFSDNIIMKERIEFLQTNDKNSIHGNNNNIKSNSVTQQLKENIEFLKEITKKIDNNIIQKKELNNNPIPKPEIVLQNQQSIKVKIPNSPGRIKTEGAECLFVEVHKKGEIINQTNEVDLKVSKKRLNTANTETIPIKSEFSIQKNMSSEMNISQLIAENKELHNKIESLLFYEHKYNELNEKYLELQKEKPFIKEKINSPYALFENQTTKSQAKQKRLASANKSQEFPITIKADLDSPSTTNLTRMSTIKTLESTGVEPNNSRFKCATLDLRNIDKMKDFNQKDILENQTLKEEINKLKIKTQENEKVIQSKIKEIDILKSEKAQSIAAIQILKKELESPFKKLVTENWPVFDNLSQSQESNDKGLKEKKTKEETRTREEMRTRDLKPNTESKIIDKINVNNDLENLIKEISCLTTTNTMKEQQIQGNKLIEDNNKLKMELEKQRKELFNMILKYESDLSNEKEMHDRLKELLDEKDQEINKLMNENDFLKSQLNELESQSYQLNDQLANFQLNIDDLKTEINQKTESLDLITKERDDLIKSNTTLQGTISRLQNAIERPNITNKDDFKTLEQHVIERPNITNKDDFKTLEQHVIERPNITNKDDFKTLEQHAIERPKITNKDDFKTLEQHHNTESQTIRNDYKRILNELVIDDDDDDDDKHESLQENNGKKSEFDNPKEELRKENESLKESEILLRKQLEESLLIITKLKCQLGDEYSNKLLEIVNYKEEIAKYKLEIVNFKVEIANYKVEIANYKEEIENIRKDKELNNLQIYNLNMELEECKALLEQKNLIISSYINEIKIQSLPNLHLYDEMVNSNSKIDDKSYEKYHDKTVSKFHDEVYDNSNEKTHNEYHNDRLHSEYNDKSRDKIVYEKSNDKDHEKFTVEKNKTRIDNKNNQLLKSNIIMKGHQQYLNYHLNNPKQQKEESIMGYTNDKSNSLIDDVKIQKNIDNKSRRASQRNIEKIMLNNDYYLIEQEINTSNKKITDNYDAYNSNIDPNIKYLSKLKEENQKLKEEKDKLSEELVKAIEHRDKLQKKLDRSPNRKSGDSKHELENNQVNALRSELKDKIIENDLLIDCLSNINSMIQTNLTKEDLKYIGVKSNDIGSTLSAVQSLTSLILEKNKHMHNRETEIESLMLKNSILEKEIIHLKQKTMAKSNNGSFTTNSSPLHTRSDKNLINKSYNFSSFSSYGNASQRYSNMQTYNSTIDLPRSSFFKSSSSRSDSLRGSVGKRSDENLDGSQDNARASSKTISLRKSLRNHSGKKT